MPEQLGSVSQLIGEVYDASLDPALWPEVLRKSAAFVGGCASALFIRDLASRTQNTVYTWGYDADFSRIYHEKYIPFDPFTTGQFFFDVGRPVCIADLMPHTEFRKTRFYAEWVQPQHWIDAVGVTLEKSLSSYSVFCVIRHETDGIADEGTCERAKLLGPHVRRAVTIGRLLDLSRVDAAVMADALDSLPVALFLTAPDGRIVHANARGREILTQRHVVHAAAGRLAAVDSAADRQLQERVAAVQTDNRVESAGASDVPLPGHGGGRFVAHVLPLTTGDRRRAEARYSARAAVFVREAQMNLPHPFEAVATAYGLTRAEMRILIAIVNVGGIHEIALALGITESTAKTHLRSIYQKTGAKRHADLVKLLAGYANPIRG